MGPAPQIAKPKTSTKQATFSTTGGGGGGQGGPAAVVAKPIQKSVTEDAPMWKVLLLGDEEYEEDPVCDVLCAVMPEVIADARQAKEKYDEAMNVGKALLVLAPFEHAEMYQEQLARADPMVFAQIEEE